MCFTYVSSQNWKCKACISHFSKKIILISAEPLSILSSVIKEAYIALYEKLQNSGVLNLTLILCFPKLLWLVLIVP